MLIISLIVGLLLLAGCSSSTIKSKDTVSKSRVATKTVENKLLQKIGKGQLVAIYDEELLISNDVEKDNYMIIKNAYPAVRDFKIEACEGCEIMNELKIEADSYHIIGFPVRGEGVKTVLVKDELGNYYGKAAFTVTRGH